MAILAVGNERESFYSLVTNQWTSSGSSKWPGQRFSMSLTGNNAAKMKFSAVSECWFRAIFLPSTSASTSSSFPLFALRNSTNNRDVLKMYTTSTAGGRTVRAATWSYLSSAPSTYTTIGTHYLDTCREPQATIDVYFKRGSSGVLKVFINEYKVFSATGNFATVDSVFDEISIAGPATFITIDYGSIIVADEPTFSMRLDHIAPNAAGTTNTWTNAYTTIDDTTFDGDTTDYIETTGSGKVFLANYESGDSLTSIREVCAVQTAARGVIESGSGILDVFFYARHASTNYTLGSIGLTGSESVGQYVMNTNPAGGAWTLTDIASLELGVITS